MTALPSIITRYRRLDNSLQLASYNKRTQIQLQRPQISTIVKIAISYKVEFEQAQKRALEAERKAYELLKKNCKLQNRVCHLKDKLDFIETLMFNIGDKKSQS